MKSRPKNRDASKADELVSQSGDDPEVATRETPASTTAEPKAVRKLGKSHADNKDYYKMMLYLQADIRAVLAERAFKSPNMDMSDIVNQLLAAQLDIDFIDPNN